MLDVFVTLMMKVTIPCLEASRDPGMFHNRMMYGAYIIRIRYLRGCQMGVFTKVKYLIGRLYFESSWGKRKRLNAKTNNVSCSLCWHRGFALWWKGRY